MSAPIDAFAALRIPSLRAFALGRVSAVLGGQMLNVAVGWGLYERTGDPWSLALVGLFELAPVIVLTIPAGTASDRYPRRNVALASHAFFILASLGLLAASEYRVSTFWIYALLMLIGASRAFGAPSIGSMLPEIVPATHLVNANAWVSSSWEIASITGPAIGGFLIAWTGSTGAAFAGGAIGHLAAAAWMLTIPATAPETRAHSRGARDLFAGFRFIWRTPELLTAMTLDLVAVLIGGAVALLPVFAKDILKIGPEGLGWLRAAPAAGALCMALLTTRLPPWQRPGRALLWTVAGFGVSIVGFGLSRTLWLSLACLFLSGAFDTVSVVIRRTLEQMLTPSHLRGRVGSVRAIFVGFSNELGAFESGALAALFGPVIAVVGGGIGTLLVVGLTAKLFPALQAMGPLAELKPRADSVPPTASPIVQSPFQ